MVCPARHHPWFRASELSGRESDGMELVALAIDSILVVLVD